ncbi:Shedu immune nuclease family protein [Saccharothrix deserti]|uniref:Shedu immune nuclease family protein n=1 Tax=Saccharothrix deserti TaxID=2593674 RepID=UPI001EE45E99|nr:Shedu immune nuclease family protein [Saccharothrix deserti]
MVEQARDLCATETGREAVIDVLRHINSGKSPFRGGRQLVKLLQVALTTAEPVEGDEVTQRLRDGIDYAEGRAFKQDMEDRYPLFRKKRSDIDLEFVVRSLEASIEYWIGVGGKFLAETPSATGAELLAHVQGFRQELPFMDAPEDRPGRYRLVRGRAETAEWIKAVLADRVDIEDVDAAGRRIAMSPDALAVLASDETGKVLLQAAELKRRQEGLAELRAVVEDPRSSEPEIHKVLEGQLWIFGGRYVGKARRRRFVEGDEVDIPLVRPDGSLCVIELKKAKVPVVTRYRNSWVVSAEVDKAISQASNYLVGLDENRQQILADHTVDTRRANAIVLIGHPEFEPKVTETTINEVFRIRTAESSRVEVLTYKELLDAAERSLEPVTR